MQFCQVLLNSPKLPQLDGRIKSVHSRGCQCEIGLFLKNGGTRSRETNNLLLVVGCFDHVNHEEEAPLAGEAELLMWVIVWNE